MTASLIAGRDVIKSDAVEVINLLEKKLRQLKSGEVTANRLCLILTDSDVETSTQSVVNHGRVTEILGLNDVAKISLLQDTETQ